MVFLFLVLFSLAGFSSVDCALVKPFKAFKKGQKFSVEAVQILSKKEGTSLVEETSDICKVAGEIEAFDIRGREEEATACLKPDKKTVYMCDTTLNGKAAQIYFLPAIWVRSWDNKKGREYRLHAVVKSLVKGDDYLDLFARTVVSSIKAADIVTEGAIKGGALGPEGFFVRAIFQK